MRAFERFVRECHSKGAVRCVAGHPVACETGRHLVGGTRADCIVGDTNERHGRLDGRGGRQSPPGAVFYTHLPGPPYILIPRVEKGATQTLGGQRGFDMTRRVTVNDWRYRRLCRVAAHVSFVLFDERQPPMFRSSVLDVGCRRTCSALRL